MKTTNLLFLTLKNLSVRTKYPPEGGRNSPSLRWAQKRPNNGALFLTGLLLAVISLSAHAKPLSYVGGIMAMQENDETGYTLSLDYTFTRNEAFGLYVKQEENGKDILMITPQLNTLLKRWNLPNGQGNIFNMSGAGLARYHDNNQPALWTAFLADYESRRFLLSYEPRFFYDGNIEKSVWQRARVGVAPYLANYNDLNTWLMFQIDHHPAKHDHFVATPLIRFFYKTYLLEVGYSSNQHIMVNWTVQF